MTYSELNILFDEAKYEEFISEAEQMSIDSDALASKLALSYFHTENYTKSTELFTTLCNNSIDPIMWFNLCTSCILNNQELKGIDALNKAIRLNRETKTNGEGMPTPFMLLYATKALIDAEKYNLAFNQLNELAEVYGSLSITDSTFLYMRGVPFFDEFAKLCKAILPKQTVTDAKEWIDYISRRLDEGGKNELLNLQTT